MKELSTYHDRKRHCSLNSSNLMSLEITMTVPLKPWMSSYINSRVSSKCIKYKLGVYTVYRLRSLGPMIGLIKES